MASAEIAYVFVIQNNSLKEALRLTVYWFTLGKYRVVLPGWTTL